MEKERLFMQNMELFYNSTFRDFLFYLSNLILKKMYLKIQKDIMKI